MDKNNEKLALEAIRKKLVGKALSYKEIYAIMDQIARDKLSDVLTTYFVASGYSNGFTTDEIYYLTKAMVETGESLSFRGVIADKHSIGGMPGGRTTPIVVPIIASAGFKIPKSSSRAITTPAGTADVMEVFCDVSFTKQQIYTIVEKTNGCLVWGGSFKIAPADDEIIRIEEPLLFESYDKILVSVMAKKIAFGASHVVIDIPYGKTMKVHSKKDAEILAEKFESLGKKFDIKVRVNIDHAEEPAANGVGPLLEGRDALKVLEQKEDRPLRLEKRAIDLSATLLTLCLEDVSETRVKKISKKYKNTTEWAQDLLQSGQALEKFKEIVVAQGGTRHIDSDHLIPGKYSTDIESSKNGEVIEMDSKNITIIARILGAPSEKKAGIFLLKRPTDSVSKKDSLCTLYATSPHKLKEAVETYKLFPIYDIK